MVKTTKASIKAGATKDDSYEEQSLMGDAETGRPVVDGGVRMLCKGTIIRLPGDNEREFILGVDTPVSGGGIEKDRLFVGLLSANQINWDLNIDQVEGTWSPVTGQRQPDEPVAEE